jgi:cytochrome c peroxidase
MTFAVTSASCGDHRAANGVRGRLLVVGQAPMGFPAGPLSATGPTDNPLTEAGAQLGKRLFFEKRLSRTGDISCATCHDQQHGFSDSRPVSLGVEGRAGTRNAPTLVNLAWGQHFFWDGRVRTLEEQVGKPIENHVEMDLPIAEAVARLAADRAYAGAFETAYGTPPSEESLRKALASFIRTLVSGQSAYDRFLAGDDAALDAAAKRGQALFFGKAACFHCHPPGALTNDGFFDNGTYVDGGDIGLQAITGRTGDLGKFKVPGLRNVAASSPYMHDGSLARLEEVVDQYDHGGRGDGSTDPLIEPLALTDGEKRDIVGFLRALTDEAFLSDTRFQPDKH